MSAEATSTPQVDQCVPQGWQVNLILWVALTMQLVRIAQVSSTSGEYPFLSANDRSRWCTIAALSVRGTYEIDDLIFTDASRTKRTPWYTIDLVRHQGRDGYMHYYSSKPPLLPTLYAGVYWCVRAATGWTLTEQPFPAARSVLVLVNLVPLGLFWWWLLRWFRREASDQWVLLMLALFVAWGTFLSTFSNTLNNHLPAAIAVGISLWCLDRILLKGDTQPVWFAICGLATSFAAANELPALSWVAAAGAMLLLVYPKRTLTIYVPGLLPVALAFFGTNYAAHQTFVPAYGHRDAGQQIATLELDGSDGEFGVDEIVKAMREAGISCSDQCIVRPARREGTFELWDTMTDNQFALKLDGDSGLKVYEWGDWYDYPNSYWAGEKQGVDRGEPDRGRYIFQCLLGHHGIFSLTPFWLLIPVGMLAAIRQRTSFKLLEDRRLWLTGAILATSIVVVSFYFLRGLEDRNYGGVSSGFRWTFWLIPLWLYPTLLALNTVRHGLARRVCELLLLASVFSATFPWSNPWTSPWLMQLAESLTVAQ